MHYTQYYLAVPSRTGCSSSVSVGSARWAERADRAAQCRAERAPRWFSVRACCWTCWTRPAGTDWTRSPRSVWGCTAEWRTYRKKGGRSPASSRRSGTFRSDRCGGTVPVWRTSRSDCAARTTPCWEAIRRSRAASSFCSGTRRRTAGHTSWTAARCPALWRRSCRSRRDPWGFASGTASCRRGTQSRPPSWTHCCWSGRRGRAARPPAGWCRRTWKSGRTFRPFRSFFDASTVVVAVRRIDRLVDRRTVMNWNLALSGTRNAKTTLAISSDRVVEGDGVTRLLSACRCCRGFNGWCDTHEQQEHTITHKAVGRWTLQK